MFGLHGADFRRIGGLFLGDSLECSLIPGIGGGFLARLRISVAFGGAAIGVGLVAGLFLGAQLEFVGGGVVAAARGRGVALATQDVAEFFALVLEGAQALGVGGRTAVLGVRGSGEGERECGEPDGGEDEDVHETGKGRGHKTKKQFSGAVRGA